MTKPTFIWGLDGLPLVARSLDGLTNVFVSASLTVTGTRSGISGSRGISNVRLATPDPGSFTPYEEVTPDDVLAWAKASMAADNGGGTAADFEQQIEDYIASKEAEAADLAKPVAMPFYTPPPPPPEEGEDSAPAQ